MPVPPQLRYVVLTNSSPYTLLVSHGMVLGELAAFTSDVFDLAAGIGGVVPFGDSTKLTVFAQPPGASTILSGNTAAQDTTLYAVWYEKDPGGTYPAVIGAGEIQTVTNFTVVDQIVTGTVVIGSPGINIPGSTGVAFYFRDITAVQANLTSWTVALQWMDSQANILASEYFALGPAQGVEKICPAFTDRVQVNIFPFSSGPISARCMLQALSTFGSTHYALETGVPILDSGTVAINAGLTATMGTSVLLYGGPAVTAINSGGNGSPWQLFFDSFNEGTGAYDPKWNVKSTDLPSSGLATGPTRALIPHMVDGSRPFRIRVTNNAGTNSNYVVYTVPGNQ